MAVPAMFSVIGGIDFDRLVIGSLAAVFTLGSCSAIALFCSIYSSNVRVAFLRSYVMVGILVFSYLGLLALDYFFTYNLSGRRNGRFLSEHLFLYGDLLSLSDMINPVMLTALLCQTPRPFRPFLRTRDLVLFFTRRVDDRLYVGIVLIAASHPFAQWRETILAPQKNSQGQQDHNHPSTKFNTNRSWPEKKLNRTLTKDSMRTPTPSLTVQPHDPKSVDQQKSSRKPLPPISGLTSISGDLFQLTGTPIFWREWYHGAALKLGVFFNVIIYLTFAGLLLTPIALTLTDSPHRSAEPFQFIWCWLMALVLLRIALQSATTISNET